MFDIFDILIPALIMPSEAEVRQQQTAFGRADERYLYVDGQLFGQVYVAKDLYNDDIRWTGSPERSNWTVLTVPGTAHSAANNDEKWARFLALVTQVLQVQSQWLIICESDCDQTTFEELELSASELGTLLDSYRTTNFSPISIKVRSKP